MILVDILEIKEYITNMKRLSKINESVWSDIRDRANGESIKKEDNIELLDRDGLLEYVLSHYDENTKLSPDNVIKSYGNEYTSFGLQAFMKNHALYRLYAYFNKNDKIYEVRLLANKSVCTDFIDELRKKFMVVYNASLDYYTFCTDEGYVTNSLYIDVFDAIIENVEKPYFKKK